MITKIIKMLLASTLVFSSLALAAKRHSTASFENRNRTSAPQDREVGLEYEMSPAKPIPFCPFYKPSGKLLGRKALVTGGDSGIGRAVAIHFCLEGADVAIACLEEEMKDALETKRLCEADVETLISEMIKIAPEAKSEFLEEGKTVKQAKKPKIIIVTGDLSKPENADAIVKNVTSQWNKIDVLVNNAGIHLPRNFSDLSPADVQHIFAVNVLSQFYLAQTVAKQMEKGDTIINTASLAAYTGHARAVDYGATKAANIGFTRSLAPYLVERGIRVNAVAPGAIYTPIQLTKIPEGQLEKEEKISPMKRMGEACELGPAYVFLAAFDSNYMTGQVLHINGGVPVNG